MSGKKDPGRFTLHFNLNDPQQRAAVDILNRNGRHKASLIARALLCYMETPGTQNDEKDRRLDDTALEQAILSVLAKHPYLISGEHLAAESKEKMNSEAAQLVSAPAMSETMDQDCRDAIQKTMSSFWAK